MTLMEALGARTQDQNKFINEKTIYLTIMYSRAKKNIMKIMRRGVE